MVRESGENLEEMGSKRPVRRTGHTDFRQIEADYLTTLSREESV
jgi:hypothetical protein